MSYKPDIELCAEFCLGDDIDCETCGMSYNRLSYTYVPVTGEHRFEVSVGCYGGENLTTSSGDEAAGFAARYADTFPGADLRGLCAAIAALVSL